MFARICVVLWAFWAAFWLLLLVAAAHNLTRTGYEFIAGMIGGGWVLCGAAIFSYRFVRGH